MFVLFFLAFAAFTKAEEVDDLPFEEDVPNQDFEEAQKNQNEEQDDLSKNDDENVEAPPPPPPQEKVRVPLKDILSLREVLVAAVFVVYVIFFIVGKVRISKKRQQVEDKVLPIIREKYFAIAPENLQKDNLHSYRCYITGRTGYQGGVVTVKFPSMCDPLGAILAAFTGKKPTITFELICKPPKPVAAVFKVANAKPEYFEQLQLKQKSFENDHKIQCYTDFGEARKQFMSKIDAFLEEHPNTIQMIELSDINEYDTKLESQYVARFEFTVPNFEFLNEKLIDFVMDLADDYVTLQLTKEASSRNEKIRDKLLAEKRKRENEEKEEKPKKLTLEEQIALDKKNAKKENRKNAPKIKAVKN